MNSGSSTELKKIMKLKKILTIMCQTTSPFARSPTRKYPIL